MRSRARVVLLVLLAATLATAFSTALAYQAEATYDRTPVDVWRLAFLNASFWYGWVLLSAPLVWLCRALRLDRLPRWALLVYIVAVIAGAFLHVAWQTSAQALARWYWMPPALEDVSWRSFWVKAFPLQLAQYVDWEIVTASAIVAMAYAAIYYAEKERRALHEAQLEARLLESQLQMLQHQLQPHFLFNTLHAISTLMHRDVQAADRMLARLSDLLRMTLDSLSRPEIRLTEELEFIEKYLHIEQVRLGDRLRIEVDIDPEVLDATVPALILQPLVENAIKHGIAPHTTPGRVMISARRHGDMLILTVDDTGPGPSERAMAALSTGIGVANTRARLSHQFGARFRFEFQRHPGGFTVLVGFPFRQDQSVTSIATFVA